MIIISLLRNGKLHFIYFKIFVHFFCFPLFSCLLIQKSESRQLGDCTFEKAKAVFSLRKFI